MPKCLLKYNWVKLPRAILPQGKGLMGYWSKLASRAAFRKGQARYCGHVNDVTPGMWSGGVVGLKSILGVKSRAQALSVMDKLASLGYIEYSLNATTKKLSYLMNDWVVKCSGAECMDGTVYTTDGYGFLCLPRDITQRLADKNYIFDDSDAWLDLWCHTTWQDPRNAFSFLAPVIQYGSHGAALTLETLGQRWGWERTKVWRFFQKHGDVFSLHRLPGAYGCLIFNKLYPSGTEVSMPSYAEIERIIEQIRISSGNTHIAGSDNARINKMILWYSKRVIPVTAETAGDMPAEDRVAVSTPIIRAYLSHCRNCENCIFDCWSDIDIPQSLGVNNIRGPCARNLDIEKENYHEQKSRQRE